MVQALLTQRNTPDLGCKLSPAQILFGRSLKDSLPYIRKKVMAHNNSRSKLCGVKHVVKRKSRYFKQLENLKEHTKPLLPLNCGDHALIQNQTGLFSNKCGSSSETKKISPLFCQG